MYLKKITKTTVAGGIVAATLFSPVQPLRTLNLGVAEVFATTTNTDAMNRLIVKERKTDYVPGTTFKDVTADKWFNKSVEQAYKLGLISGKPGNLYDPQGHVTIAEVLSMASKTRSYGMYGEYWVEPTTPWYKGAVDYCNYAQITAPNEYAGRYNEPAKRDVVAHILAHVFEEDTYAQLNKRVGVYDVSSATTKYYEDIYKLYDAGIVSGSTYGMFHPESYVTRAEMASLLVRLANPNERTRTLPQEPEKPSTEYVPPVSSGGSIVTPNLPKPEVPITPPTTPVTPEKPAVPEKPKPQPQPQPQPKPEETEETEEPKDLKPVSPEDYLTGREFNPDEDQFIRWDGGTVIFIENGSSCPDPEEYADWFFDYYMKGKARDGACDEMPQNWEECAEAIINRLRAKEGSGLISYHPVLSEVSKIRAQECSISFSHDRPNGGDFYDLMLEVGYRQPGEMLGGCAEAICGGGYLTDAMLHWIKSPDHYKVLTHNGNPTVSFGLGTYPNPKGHGYYWVFNTGDY